MRRILIGVLALGVGVAAVAWVSVPFTDRAYSCGTALGEWQDGVRIPNGVMSPAALPADGTLLTSSPVAIDLHDPRAFVTLCRGQARGRLVESFAAVGVVVLAVVLIRRRAGGATPPLTA